MTEREEKLIKSALCDCAESAEPPTPEQTEEMLGRVLAECGGDRRESGLFRLLAEYPWRAAFVLSAGATAVLTLAFGAQYTNLFLGIFGG